MIANQVHNSNNNSQIFKVKKAFTWICCSFCQSRLPKIHIGLRGCLPPGMGSTAHTSSPSTKHYALSNSPSSSQHLSSSLHNPSSIHQQKRPQPKTLCSWGNNRLIQVLLLSSDNSHLESPTSHCSYCPNRVAAFQEAALPVIRGLEPPVGSRML